MSSVDDFLENVAADFASLQKDNAILKGKMKVLVEKIEEYRATEDAMRMALLSAQKMANQIVAEAKENSEAALNAARAEAEKLERTARAKVSSEEAKLVEAQRASAKYIDNLRLFSQKHLEFLDALSEQKFGSIVTPPPAAKKAIAEAVPEAEPEAAPAADEELEDAVRAIGDRVVSLAEEVEAELDVDPNIGCAEEEADEQEPTRLYTFPREGK
jgi:cell division initiation protein